MGRYIKGSRGRHAESGAGAWDKKLSSLRTEEEQRSKRGTDGNKTRTKASKEKNGKPRNTTKSAPQPSQRVAAARGGH